MCKIWLNNINKVRFFQARVLTSFFFAPNPDFLSFLPYWIL